MDYRTAYHDVCLEIDILRMREDDLIKVAQMAKKACWNGQIDRNTHIPLNKALYNFDVAMENLQLVRSEIERKEALKLQMEQRMEITDTLEHKVAYMRDIQKMQLYMVADKLNLSYSYVRKVSMRAPRLRYA